MSESLTIDFNQPLPVFPLPGCILLPHATIPLHFFEPRYVRMVEDTLQNQRLICTAMFQGEDWKTHYEGCPPIRACVCVGYIIQHADMPDGRYNVLLQGLCRANVVFETTDTGRAYRTAMVQPVASELPLGMDLSSSRQTIEQLLADPLLTQLASVTAVNRWVNPELATEALVDLGTMSLCEESQLRYQMLQEPDALARARLFIHFLQQTRDTLRMAQRLAPRELIDHMHLN